MSRSYEFLAPLSRLMEAYRRYEGLIVALDAIALSIAFYVLALLLGLPAFAGFYWQDFLLLAASPAILSLALGATAALLLRRRRRVEIFSLLGPKVGEMARTAYDNRDEPSLPMQTLASELCPLLSRINPSELLDQRRIGMRIAAVLILSGSAAIIAQSQIGADITPSDLHSLAHIGDRALEALQGEGKEEPSGANLTGGLYGKPSLAVLHEQRLELLLYPGEGAGSRARGTEPVDRAFLQSEAGDASAVPSELYIESLPPEGKEIVKRYFTLLGSGS